MRAKKRDEVFVWPLCTRIIHWMIASSFFLSFLTSFYAHLFKWHIAFGMLFGFVLCFRLIWGFIGSNYGTFQTFKLGFNDLKEYFREKIKNRWRKIHAGHNAASSWFTLIVLGSGLLGVLSGLLLQGIQEGSGFFAFLNPFYFQSSALFLFVHQGFSYFLLYWAMIHIVGVLIEQFYHKTHMVFAMVTGYKKAEGNDTLLSAIHHLFAYSIIALSGLILYDILTNPQTIFLRSRFSKIDFKAEHPLFYEKCSKCHKIYPPFMLPRGSWERLMQGLENHFGEAITEDILSKRESQTITDYLITNASETSSHKLAFHTLRSLDEMRPISMTKVPYWRERHQGINASTYQRLHVKDPSQCFACHEAFDEGILDNLHLRVSK